MNTLWQIARMPVQLFIAKATGLTAALLDDGIGDFVGWGCLAFVVSVALRCCFRRMDAGRRSEGK